MGFHNANAIVDQMMVHLQIDEDECTATATQHATELASANQANATMDSQVQTLLSQVQSLQISNTHGNQTNHGETFGRRRSRVRGLGASRGTRRGCTQSSTPLTPKYFWTRGNFSHGVDEFTYPSEGHKKDAAFVNMMGGNTSQCYNITYVQVGAVELRNNKSNILSLNKPTVAHSP